MNWPPRWTIPQLPNPAEWFHGIQRDIDALKQWLRGVNEGIEQVGRTMKRLRAAERTERAIDLRPSSAQRKLTVITVRCPGGKRLLRVVRIPDHLPGADLDRHLVIPTSATTWRVGDESMDAFAWFLADHEDGFTVRCRCHDEIGLTKEQLLGESPPPHGIRVLAS